MRAEHVNVRHLFALAAVVEHESVSLAARVVNLTQPAVTQAIAKLETQLGIAMFERRPGGMVPTEAALRLKPRIDAALRLIGSRRVTTAQIRAFVALARAGSFVAASEATGLAQPSLHRSVSDLAHGLGVELVERRGRGLMLTRQGTDLSRRLRLAQAELRQGLDELAELVGEAGRPIVVGAMPVCRARLLPDALLRFRASHPDVGVSIHEGAFVELVGPLRDGEIDLMIGALRDASQYPDLNQHALFTDHPRIVARAGHPLEGGWEAADLRRFPWLLPVEGAPLRQLWHRMFEAIGGPLPETPIECGSVMTIRQLLNGSDFLALVSIDQVAFELEAGVLIDLGAAPGDVTRTIGLIVRRDWRPTPTQQAFIAFVKQGGTELNS